MKIAVLLVVATMAAHAQYERFVFPQFAHGGGWQSTLMLQAMDPSSTVSTCWFWAWDGDYVQMWDYSGNHLSFPAYLYFEKWMVLKTATPHDRAVSSNMVMLSCPPGSVSAALIFSLEEADGSVVGAAVVEPAQEVVGGGDKAQFLVDHRDGARLGVAVANGSDQRIDASVSVVDSEGRRLASTSVAVGPYRNTIFMLDELLTIPEGFTGQVLIGTETGASVYAVALRFTGQTFTTIPVAVRSLTTAIDPATAQVWPKDADFNDRFWRELVYDEYEEPSGVADGVSFVLPDPTAMNVYLRTDPWPRNLPRNVWIPRIRDQIGSVVHQLTGERWQGQLATGPERTDQSGWITIRFLDFSDNPNLSPSACGSAYVGAIKGKIFFNMTCQGISPGYFPHLLAHELGHSFGFFHVSDSSAMMFRRGNQFSTKVFIRTERYHARLAYEKAVGRDRPYCGWPYSADCLSPKAKSRRAVRPVTPRLVVD